MHSENILFASYNQILKAYAAQHGIGGVPINYFPGRESLSGELTTDFFIHLGAALREPPEKLAEECAQQCDAAKIEVVRTGGHLTFPLPAVEPTVLREALCVDQKIKVSSESTSQSPTRELVVLPWELYRRPGWFRLAAIAHIQKIATGNERIERRAGYSGQELQTLVAAAKDLIQNGWGGSSSTNGNDERIIAWAEKAMSQSSSSTLLVPPMALIGRSTSRAVYDKAHGQVSSPGHIWLALSERDAENIAKTFYSLSQSEDIGAAARLRAIVWYLAGAVNGEDLDPSVPALQESANLTWFIGVVSERLRRIADELAADQLTAGRPDSRDRVDNSVHETAIYRIQAFRQSVVRLLFLPNHLAAAMNGELGNLQSATNDNGSVPEFFRALDAVLHGLSTLGTLYATRKLAGDENLRIVCVSAVALLEKVQRRV